MYRTSDLDTTPSPQAAALLNDIYRRIGSNVESQALAALSSVPGCLESFWAAVEPVWNGCLVRSAADELSRRAAQLSGESIHLPDYLDWLTVNGFTREDSRQIRYVVETFANLEPILAVIAVLARQWLRGAGPETPVPIGECLLSPGPVFTGSVLFAGDSGQLWRLFPDVGGPETRAHPFLRALCVWPSYARKVHEDLHNPACALCFGEVIGSVCHCVESVAEPLVGLVGPCRGPSTGGVLAAVERSLQVSCGVIVLSGALRRSFIRGEVRARTARTRTYAV